MLSGKPQESKPLVIDGRIEFKWILGNCGMRSELLKSSEI
jgi:hypothetical protein